MFSDPVEYQNLLNNFLIVWSCLAVILFPIQIFQTAPYGRHLTTSFIGKTTARLFSYSINNRIGWIIMETVSPIALLVSYFHFLIPNQNNHFFIGLWCLHYFHRCFIFPFQLRTSVKEMPLTIVLFAILFNTVNGITNGISFALNHHSISQIQFHFGMILFVIGAFINITSDYLLIHLRKPGEIGYKIPQGMLFQYLSCPNLFGEIIEWFGFAIACNHFSAFCFALWTLTNLGPRAYSTHSWYLKKFPTYPKNRFAVIPFVF